MNRLSFAVALAACSLAQPAIAAEPHELPTDPQLTLDERTLLRCSAVFAIIAYEQGQGVESALAWPPLAERGKEYFVQAGAKLMEAHHLSDADVTALYRAEIKRLQDESGEAADPQALVTAIMQPCLLSLELSEG